jgi:hypothetical protein
MIPKHVRRALDCVDSILINPRARPIGQIVEALCKETGTWDFGEVMNVQQTPDGDLYYYVHLLGKPKRDDDWFCDLFVRDVRDMYSLRLRICPGESIKSHAHDHVESASSSPSNLWPGFFQLSQLTKQTTSGTSVYGSSSAGNHDPHEYSPKTIVGIDYGGVRIKAWYRSPYPRSMWSPDRYLWVCNQCLGFADTVPSHHDCSVAACGSIVYADRNLKIREIDGLDDTEFCIRLFLLAKLFLEDKRTSADESSQFSQVTPFLFYALFEEDGAGRERFVGYFSKYKIQKKDSPILSCIMILPSEQRKGFGKLLISAAYELSKREGRQGSAERPLSGPGLAAFMSWWTSRLQKVVSSCFDGETLTISQLSDLSGMTSEDVVETLRNCGSLKEWGSLSGGDVKLRESGKRTKVKMTLALLRSLEARCPSRERLPNEFRPDALSDNARLCSVVYTPMKV